MISGLAHLLDVFVQGRTCSGHHCPRPLCNAAMTIIIVIIIIVVINIIIITSITVIVIIVIIIIILLFYYYIVIIITIIIITTYLYYTIIIRIIVLLQYIITIQSLFALLYYCHYHPCYYIYHDGLPCATAKIMAMLIIMMIK